MKGNGIYLEVIRKNIEEAKYAFEKGDYILAEVCLKIAENWAKATDTQLPEEYEKVKKFLKI
jgi:hypothetical protein